MVKQLRTPEQRLSYADALIKVDMKTLNLDFWQEDFIKDTSPYSLTTKSRRTGFSFIVAMKGLIKAMDPARYKYVRQFVSYNEDDAKEKIIYAKEFYHSIPPKNKKPLVSETKTTMEFYDTRKKTTSRLISIACRPPRGKGGDIVFDEFAIYPKNKADIIYTAGLPVVARGGAVEIGSTPLGMIGRFYEILTDEITYSKYTRLTIPWWFANALCTNVPDAVKLAREMETEERVKKYGSEHIQDQFLSMLLEDFQQEYECMFIDSVVSYITMELIWANTPGMREGERNTTLLGGDIEKDKEIQPEEEIEVKAFRDADSLLAGYPFLLEKYSNGEPIRLYLGYDVARRRDAAVVFLVGKLPSGKKLSVAEIEMKNTKFEDQLDVVRKIMHNLPVIRAAMDMTGMGEPLYERLQAEFSAARVEGVLFNAENKGILALGVRTGLENNEFLLQNDKRFHKQIHSIKRIPNGIGFRYDSERDQDGHADSFWAWALANYAVVEVKETRPGFYQQIKAKKEAVATIETKTAGVTKPVKARGKSLNSLLSKWDKKGG
jgi:phage FluMu gp28-like protein